MNKVVVSEETFDEVVKRLAAAPYKSFDTETTGLRPYQGHELFSIIFAVGDDVAYFNFNPNGKPCLPRGKIAALQPIFNRGMLYAHNAKFDWHMVAREGIDIQADVWCTQTGARVLYNNYGYGDDATKEYALAACAERIGLEKDDAVEQYVKDHKLWDWVTIPGKKLRKKDKHYELVPFDIMVPYGCRDGVVTYKLGEHQRAAIAKEDAARPKNRPPMAAIMDMEMGVTRVCQGVEARGAAVDLGYCQEAAHYEEGQMRRLEALFTAKTGLPFKDSNKTYARAFTNLGLEYGTTAKGNPSFDDKTLSKIDNPVARIIKDWRTAQKRSGTYFRSYIFFGDDYDRIHANQNQAATVTGRFSSSDPNLTNIPKRGKEKHSQYPVRRAIIPTLGNCLVSIDFSQMEFRLMLDYANEAGLIRKILDGHDPHDATAEMTGLDRDAAKTLNFALLYGMGKDTLAETLGVSVKEAKEFKYQYFGRLPQVKKFLRAVTTAAERRGFITDWAGRRLYFPDPRFAYKAPNALIQGGCSSIHKKAMVATDKVLAPWKSDILFQVHDEIDFDMHPGELELVPRLKEEMEKIYPYKRLPMRCSVEHSWKSFGDLVEGMPDVA